jgi:hypothetical protein
MLGYGRLRNITKRVGGKLRRYKNLASFNSECSTRGIGGVTHNACTLTNLRCTKDGGGLATVQSVYPGPETRYARRGKPSGTWLLHFASCSIMKRHLRNRVRSRPGTLAGAGRRRRRR